MSRELEELQPDKYDELAEFASLELAKRRKARESLSAFAQAVDIPGAPATDPDTQDDWLFEPVETGLADHHRLMCERIQDVFEGRLPRMMLFLPPGSAKSTYGSVVAPTWLMGRVPETKILLTTYGQDLSKKHGRRARQLCRSKKYKGTFGVEISGETSAVDLWALENGSEYMSAGLLTGITGSRCHGLIIDDPIKGRAEADSEVIRQRTWDAYQEDARTRLIPGGWEILIQTRWHEDDVAGRLLPEDYNGETGMIRCRDGRDWYVLCLPAQCERDDDPLGRKRGEYLWPEWFTPEHFEGFKVQSRTWSALFQQRPAPEEGTYFQRSWFPRFDVAKRPKWLNIYMAGDFGVTEDDGDETEIYVIGVDPSERIYVLDHWGGQTTADVWIDAILDLVETWKPFAFFGEAGVIRRATEPFIKKRMRQRKTFCRVEWVTRTANKIISARGIQGYASQGMVSLPHGPIGDEFLDEATRFPAGKKDNKVDALANFGLALDQQHPALVPHVQEEKPFTERLIDHLNRPDTNYEAEFFGAINTIPGEDELHGDLWG